MSAQINNYNFSTIGRMFARQNVPSVYGMQKAAGEAEAEPDAAQVDRVSLSPFAPRPLNAGLFRDAVDTARTLGEGGKLTADQAQRLREDRIFAAVAALATVGDNGADAQNRSWPGGIPAPTQEEMEVARRRLSQRLDSEENLDDAEAARAERVELLRKIGKRDLSGFFVTGDDAVAALSAAS